MDDLNKQIETLRDAGKTQEQLAKESHDKLIKKHQGELQKSDETGKLWKGRYETYRTKTDIQTAAHKHKALNPTQIYEILRNHVSFVEVMDADGKPTGEIEPRVKIKETDKDGKVNELSLDIEAAVKRMTEGEEHANLFESGASSGLGGRNNGRKGASGDTTIPTNTSSYMAVRKKNPNFLKEGTKA